MWVDEGISRCETGLNAVTAGNVTKELDREVMHIYDTRKHKYAMRTTIDIDDNVLAHLKRIAADRGESLRTVIHELLRAELARRTNPDREASTDPLITFAGNGTRPGVEIDSNADLLDLMEGKT